MKTKPQMRAARFTRRLTLRVTDAECARLVEQAGSCLAFREVRGGGIVRLPTVFARRRVTAPVPLSPVPLEHGRQIG